MADNQYEVVLSAKGCSGRGVRFRELTAPEVDGLAVEAIKAIGSDATVAQFRIAETREGIVRMLTSVTRKGGLTRATVRELRPADWQPLTEADLMNPNGELAYEKLFRNSKDHAVLGALFAQYHKVSQSELDAIVGEALPVSGD